MYFKDVITEAVNCSEEDEGGHAEVLSSVSPGATLTDKQVKKLTEFVNVKKNSKPKANDKFELLRSNEISGHRIFSLNHSVQLHHPGVGRGVYCHIWAI